jgi:prevent-host-death family protein
MPDSIDTYAAKTQLSRLLARVEAGEEIVITRRGKPVARLVPAAPRRPRIIGLLKGQFTAPDDINDGDEEIARLFEEGEIEPKP